MSKPIKKTDQNKSWFRKQNASKSKAIPASKTFLIVCEGQTEELYFKSFGREGVDLKCVWMGCTKMELVDCTIDLKVGVDYDQVWVVFDMDYDGDRGGTQFERFDNAIDKASKNNIKTAYSNDAFELWFYLHYQYTEQQNLRFFYYKQLSKLWGINYEKDGKSRAFASKIFQRLEDDDRADIDMAIESASKLHHKMITQPYHQQNPTTRVFALVQELRSDADKW